MLELTAQARVNVWGFFLGGGYIVFDFKHKMLRSVRKSTRFEPHPKTWPNKPNTLIAPCSKSKNCQPSPVYVNVIDLDKSVHN